MDEYITPSVQHISRVRVRIRVTVTVTVMVAERARSVRAYQHVPPGVQHLRREVVIGIHKDS